MKSDLLYAGKILRVDLTHEKVETLPTAAYVERFLGGRGIGVRLVWENLASNSVDPLGPNNILSFESGPLTGTMMPGSGRCHLSSKSPMTGLLGLASFGGSFAPELKYAGYDHLLITGQASQPVYLVIENEEVTIRSAVGLWGLDTYETPKALRRELRSDEVKWACIGPAGERLVRFATIVSSTMDSMGRSGLGAVMGAKRLKAVVLRGTGGVRVANPDRFYEFCARAHDALKAKDFRREGETGEKSYQKTGCFSCPIRCMDDFSIPGFDEGVPLYSWHAEMACKIGIRDPMILKKLALRTNKDGLDALSLGELMVWVTKLFEQGILDEKEIGFPVLRGDSEAYLRLTEMIARREGFGDLLAEGLMHAAGSIGRGSEQYALPLTQSLIGETTEQGEVWQRSLLYYGRFAEEVVGSQLVFPREWSDKAETIARTEEALGRAEMLGICKWHTEFGAMSITAEMQAEALAIGLGEKITAEEISFYEQRMHLLERAFDCREGLRREHDTLSFRTLAHLDPQGCLETTPIDRNKFELMRDRYYERQGWDLATGVPTRATLEAFGLRDAADELESRGILQQKEQRTKRG